MKTSMFAPLLFALALGLKAQTGTVSATVESGGVSVAGSFDLSDHSAATLRIGSGWSLLSGYTREAARITAGGRQFVISGNIQGGFIGIHGVLAFGPSVRFWERGKYSVSVGANVVKPFGASIYPTAYVSVARSWRIQ